ncbi:RecX family transcriptional regulator [Erysipelothrix inopinata]|uniref:Regulatory protein RecX n=1 Tax=Erysipelothrix inopinata TaxID=225084 RepID=A0A7G9RYS2_9FIRM|nr:RecX family transcriptional regulator [Erysipelothrix inopinata]QNN60747.1 RecX family transcriptional regulator [Erysipelothrix inopinata]
MRIGLFTDTYTPDINGVVTSIVTLKNALEKQGHAVFVVTNQPSIISTTYEDGVLRLPGVELKFLYGYVLSSPLHIQAQAVIEEMELDVIHVHSEFGIGMFARVVARNLHLPLISTYHTTYEDYTHYVNLLGLKSVDQLSRKAVAKMSRMFSKSAQVVIAPSDKTKKMLLGYDIKKEIAVIPTGLDLDRFKVRNEEELKGIREKYNIDPETSLFVYIGRLAKEKSIDVVIEAFAVLLKRDVNAKLMIVGGGPSDSELEIQAHKLGIADKVIFVGPVSSDQVVNYYHVANAFISASLTETQGLTYIEALACGLCVFARPDKPLEGIIEDDITGYLFTSSEEFADKAYQFITADENKKKELHDTALSYAQTYDSKLFADRVLEVYQKGIDVYFGKATVLSVDDRGEEIYLSLETKSGVETMIIDPMIQERREIEVGSVMSRNELNEIEDDQIVYEAYQLALSRIGVRDYTSFEMAEYLREKRDLTQEQIDIIISLLEKRRFIDDERYFRDKIEYHREQMRGNHRIVEDLTKRGFDIDKIQDALEDEDYDDYLARATKRSESFLRTVKDGSTRQREAKLGQHLQRQGFDFNVINDVIRNMEDPYSEGDEYDSLRAVMLKSFERYSKRYDDNETRNRVVKNALSRGYNYDMIAKVMEELKDED